MRLGAASFPILIAGCGALAAKDRSWDTGGVRYLQERQRRSLIELKGGTTQECLPREEIE